MFVPKSLDVRYLYLNTCHDNDTNLFITINCNCIYCLSYMNKVPFVHMVGY